MEHYPFTIDERAACVWDWRLREKNQRFLKGVDPGYFEYIAERDREAFEANPGPRPALALRLTYSHALETFMAFAAAAIQAPACPLGWILRYQNRELESVIEKLTHCRPLLTRLSVSPTWAGLAEAVVQPAPLDDVEKQEMARRFAGMWSRFASDFLDVHTGAEYNSVKHGLRVASGGFVLRMGIEETPGVRPPDDAMQTVGASQYGSSFFVVEKPLMSPIDFRPRNHSRNWHPENLYHGIRLLALSLGNVLSFLRLSAGEKPEELQLQWPEDSDGYVAPWSHSVGTNSINLDLVVRPEDLNPMSAADILATYRR